MLEPTELRALDARPTELDFEGFFRAEYPRLARACYLLTGEAAEAEDLAQEAMARTFERWNRIRAMDSPPRAPAAPIAPRCMSCSSANTATRQGVAISRRRVIERLTRPGTWR